MTSRTALCLPLPLLCLGALLGSAPAHSADNEPVIQPQVLRREIKLPRIPSRDFELALFAGTYATQNFGASPVAGVRLGYHLSEDFFAMATLAATRVSDESFRQILPGGVFGQRKEALRYANIAAGWNVLPGEVFLGNRVAKASAVYLIGGLGSTHFAQQSRQTFHVGAGMRLILRDGLALQFDMRDHVFSLDLLGKRQSTQNLEMTAGMSLYF